MLGKYGGLKSNILVHIYKQIGAVILLLTLLVVPGPNLFLTYLSRSEIKREDASLFHMHTCILSGV